MSHTNSYLVILSHLLRGETTCHVRLTPGFRSKFVCCKVYLQNATQGLSLSNDVVDLDGASVEMQDLRNLLSRMQSIWYYFTYDTVIWSGERPERELHMYMLISGRMNEDYYKSVCVVFNVKDGRAGRRWDRKNTEVDTLL